MPTEAVIPLPVLYAFLFVLARVSGALIFVPIPGVSNGPEPARIVLSVGCTLALYPIWPNITETPGFGAFAGWMMAEAALGLTVGLVTGLLSEAFVLCGQMVGLQAGYSYASTIDPNTNADATMLSIVAQLMAGLLFFTLGLHRAVLRIFAASLETHPPGTFEVTLASAEGMLRLGSTIFSTGLRLALPVVALLLMVDLALAMLGRINAQLQLLSLAFPAKMLTSLAMLALMAALFPRVFRTYAETLFASLPALLAR